MHTYSPVQTKYISTKHPKKKLYALMNFTNFIQKRRKNLLFKSLYTVYAMVLKKQPNKNKQQQ